MNVGEVIVGDDTKAVGWADRERTSILSISASPVSVQVGKVANLRVRCCTASVVSYREAAEAGALESVMDSRIIALPRARAATTGHEDAACSNLIAR